MWHTSLHDEISFEHLYFLQTHPPNCDWFLKLDVKLLVLKFSSIIWDFDWRI